MNTTLLIWPQLNGIIGLKDSGSINAAVTCQDWPAACAPASDEDMECLIGNFVNMTMHAILNSQCSDSHH